MATTVTLNDKEYNIDELSEEARRLANNIVFADAKIKQLRNEAAVIQAGRVACAQALSGMLEEAGETSDAS